MSFKKLSKIDERTKYAVYGWIRKAEEELSFRHVPLVITSICILYFYEDEIFEIVSDNIKVSSDRKILKTYPLFMLLGYETYASGGINYGSVVIPSMSDIRCQWDLRLNDLKTLGNRDFIIGISSRIVTHGTFTRSNYDFGSGLHYVMKKENATTTETARSRRIRKGDKVSIHLDLNQSQIRFFINDKDQGTAYNNITKKKDITYRLMVMLSHNVEIEILDFRTF